MCLVFEPLANFLQACKVHSHAYLSNKTSASYAWRNIGTFLLVKDFNIRTQSNCRYHGLSSLRYYLQSNHHDRWRLDSLQESFINVEQRQIAISTLAVLITYSSRTSRTVPLVSVYHFLLWLNHVTGFTITSVFRSSQSNPASTNFSVMSLEHNPFNLSYHTRLNITKRKEAEDVEFGTTLRQHAFLATGNQLPERS